MTKQVKKIENTQVDKKVVATEKWNLIKVGDELQKVKHTKKFLKKDYQTIGKYPIISQEAGKIAGFTNSNSLFTDLPVVIFGDHTRHVKYVDFPFCLGADGVKLLKPSKKFDVKFFYYAIKNLDILNKGYSRHFSLLKDKQISLPPLEIQKEIVSVLDSFTELEAELEAELESRKKQYEYYRNEILTFSESERVKYLKLGDLTMNTNNIKWKETENHYRYIDLTSVDRDTHSITKTINISSNNAPSRAQKIIQKNDVIFATTRPTLQRFTIIDDEYDGQIASTGYCVLRANNHVLSKWIYYNIAKSEFNDYVEKNQKGASYPAISDSKVKEFKIPVPQLTEQKRIVSILDKFDILVNDISEGIPAEIKARRNQYEYYREKLLTFK